MDLDLTADGNYNAGTDNGGLDDLGTITDEAEIGASSADDVYFSFQADAELGNGDTAVITLPSTYTAAACTTPTTDVDADGSADGSFGFAGNVATYTATAATTLGTTTGLEFCVNVTVDASAGNEVVSYSDDAGNSGAGFIYNEDDNDIAVTADVNESLLFVLRNSADDADTNACALGTLSASAVAECEYRIALSTAAANGADVYIQDTSASAGLTSGADDIDAIVEDSTTGGTSAVDAGVEEYGIELAAATVGGTMNESGDFTDDDTPIPTAKTQILDATGQFVYAQGTTTTSSLVTHRASIDAATASGSYTQTVSYYVTANY